MRIYMICPVRKCTPEIRAQVDAYVAQREAEGYKVHYPPRDVQQTLTGAEIAQAHRDAMLLAQEVHIWWTADNECGFSSGTYWDAGMMYMMMAFNRKLRVVVANPPAEPPHEKTYLAVLMHLHDAGRVG